MTRSERSAVNRAQHATTRAADIAARKRVRDDERAARIAAWRSGAAPIAATLEPVASVDVAPLPKRRSCSEARRKGGLRAAETRAESDDAVRANISPSLIPYRACELDAESMPDESESDYTARQRQNAA